MKLKCAYVLLAGSLAAVAVAGGDPVAAVGDVGVLRDGHWAGTMQVGASIDLSQTDLSLLASTGGSGAFDLLMAGGVASGEFVFNGTSVVTLDSAGGIGTAESAHSFAGVIGGTTAFFTMEPQSGHLQVTGVLTLPDGGQVPLDTSFDLLPQDMNSTVAHTAAAACGIASGTWATDLPSRVDQAGGTVSSFEGSWAATFEGADPAATNETLATLLARGEATISEWLTLGVFNDQAISQVLRDAEAFATTAAASDECESASPGEWASPLAGLVTRLIQIVSQSPQTTGFHVVFAVHAGLRTGVLPSLESDPLEADLKAKTIELLDFGIANNQEGLVPISIAADAMGWTDVAEAALAVLFP